MASHDAIIIGGGIQGAMIALECVRRGRRPLIIERGAFGEGATGNSFGIVHGGLRYLQSLDIARWRRSRREQMWFVREFRSLVSPLPCVMPLYRGTARSRLLFRAAFMAQRLASRFTGLSGAATETGFLSLRQARSFYPIPEQGLVGAAYWRELAIPDTPALVRAIIERVVDAGGEAIERQEALELLCQNGHVMGLAARDEASTGVVRHFADTIFLCAGSATQELAARFDRPIPALSARTLAFNLLLDAPAPKAVALAVSPTPGRGRSLFLREQDGRLLAGTAYAPIKGLPGAMTVPQREIDLFLADIVRAVPSLAGVRVLDVWPGCLPDMDGHGAQLRDKDFAWDHGRHDGPHGLHSVTPTKLTTAHAHACDVLDGIWPMPKGAPDTASRTASPTRRPRRKPVIGVPHLGKPHLGKEAAK